MLKQFKEISHSFWVYLDDEKTKIFSDTLQKLHSLFGEDLFASDNTITFRRNFGFLKDEKFRVAFDKNSLDDIELSIVWRMHLVCWATNHCLHIPGDFVECGVYKGCTSRIIVDYTNFKETDKSFYLYDLFERVEELGVGLDSREFGKGLVDYVRSRFSDLPNVYVIQGKVPDSLSIDSPERIAFMHIDMNNAPAERGALEVLWDRVSSGGIVIFDDYGWTQYRAQKITIDDFLNVRNHYVVELPTGQGMVIKKNI